MNTRKRLALATAGLALGGGLAAAPAATAAAPAARPSTVTAARTVHGCPAGAVCAYSGDNYKGRFLVQYGNTKSAKNQGKTVYSVYNNGNSCAAWIYGHKNWSGHGYKLNRHTGWKHVGGNLWHVRSISWCHAR